MSSTLTDNFQNDVNAVNEIPIIAEMLDIICQTTGMGFAAVARVTDTNWVACAVADKIGFGLQPGGELALETTICNEIRQHRQPVAFDNVALDPIFLEHHTPKLYGLQSYISVPLVLRNGQFFGTLCAIDPKPNVVNNSKTLTMFKFYADLLAFHLQAVDDLEISDAALKLERENAGLREQFIAVLGHDLRNPVSAVKNVAQLLLRRDCDADAIKRLANILTRSSQRMITLIENVTDFARDRLGAGIILQKNPEDLHAVLSHVVDELQLSWPERTISTQLDLAAPVISDGKRIAQLFSNLLGNALSHGGADSRISVWARETNNEFLLSVSNTGKPISAQILPNLFAPFTRGYNGQEKDGLGLGLFISSGIAKAHSGIIEVQSDEEATIFTFKMPLER